MFDKIIAYSINNKFVIGLLVLALVLWGLFSLSRLPIDAVPDITNNQVQVITSSPSLATQEVEQFITSPIELALQNIQQLEEIRSISRFGLSVVTVVFEEDMDLYLARQLVSEHLKIAQESIPDGLGTPEMSPISTGLGEIYQYVVFADEGYEDKYSLSDLRTAQDWDVKRQLSGIDGVVEVNTLGGFLKQYEVAVDPLLLKSMNLSIMDIYDALQNSNENTGGAYIEKNPKTYYIRTDGIVKSNDDIGNIVVAVRNGNPVLIKDVSTVQEGAAPRYGALTRDGREAVGGTVMMLKGSNSKMVTAAVKDKMVQIQKSLPEGMVIEAYLDRDKLISTAIGTVRKNLIEGGLIVVFILVLLLGNWRASLIVASVIPLSMLFAIGMMRQFDISANLMSLGAIDFGLIVDGAVIIVEAIVHRLQKNFAGQKLTKEKMDAEVFKASKKIRNSAAFGEIIILMVYIPILALVGIEGKMFRPMAQTVMLAIAGALILSLTYVPMMSALFLNKNISNKKGLADKIISWCQSWYAPLLDFAMRFKKIFVGATLVVLLLSLFVFSRMGGEFIPTLEEGDFALHQILPPGSSLTQSIEMSIIIQHRLMSEFPEIEDIVTKIGSAEIPTDPMPIETGDIMVIMKPKSEWTSASTRQGMYDKMEHALHDIPGIKYEFSQPIQMRFNELMTGSRADIAIKLYGDDLDILFEKGTEAKKLIQKVAGVGSVEVEQVVGMPQIVIHYDYTKLAQYGLQVKTVNRVIKTAFAGEKAGIFYEGDKTFDLVVRLKDEFRKDIVNVEDLYVTLDNGMQIPITEVASVKYEETPMQISRDNTKRRIVIGVNVGDTDVTTLVEAIQPILDKEVNLPPGYYFTYGGQFENLEKATDRLMIAVPIALGLIFILLFFTFNSMSQAVLIFTAIPFSAIGGIWALQLRGMPFSISAGIGFIALFGVAVLNGIVLIGYFNQLKKEGVLDLKERIKLGTEVRLRPVLLTAAVASLGFLPMALSNSGGAEVQRPLATVVIGGLLTATFLTLILLPILYYWLEKWKESRPSFGKAVTPLILILLFINFSDNLNGQSNTGLERVITLDEAINIALKNNPTSNIAQLEMEKIEMKQNMLYNFGNTSINYQGDGLFIDNPQKVNSYGVEQSFSALGISRSNNRYQKEIMDQVRMNQEISMNDLTRHVTDAYNTLQYYQELGMLYKDLSQTYSSFYDIAKIRQEVGSIGNLEAMSLKLKYEEQELLENQIQLELVKSREELHLLLNAKDEKYLTTSFTKLNYNQTDSINGLSLNLAKQEVAIASAKLKVLKAQNRPSFNLGYAAQDYFESGWLHSVQGGIQIPLFNRPATKSVKIQKMEIDLTALRFEAKKITFKKEINNVKKAIDLYDKGVIFYSKQLKNFNPELTRIAKLNYQEGAISYLELLNSLEITTNNHIKYLDQLLEYNKAVSEYNYLTQIKN